MRALCVLAALVALAAAIKELPLLESTIQHATLKVNFAFTGITTAVAEAARLIENQLELGLVTTSLHLTNLTFFNNTYPILQDANPARVSEFIVSNEALTTAPEFLDKSVGGNGTCACRAERDALCAKYNATPGELPCLRCDRACEVLFMYRLTSSLDSWVRSAARNHPLVSAWYWERDNGNLSQDLCRLYIVLPDGQFAFGPTVIADGSESWGTKMSLLVYRRPLFDRTPAWSKPYIDFMTQMSCVTVAVPAWSSSGESLGGFEADMLMADSREFFLNLSLVSPIPMRTIMTVQTGDVIAAAGNASGELFGSCLGVVCNVYTLSTRLIGAEWSSSSSYVEVELDGRLFLVFRTNLEQGWYLWFFVLDAESSNVLAIAISVVIPVVVLSVLFGVTLVLVHRYMHNRVAELEGQLDNVASASVLNTPAEDVIKTLLKIRNEPRLSRTVRDDVVSVIAVVASNRLFKAESNLKQKLEGMKLDKDVDRYLLDVLAHHNESASDMSDASTSPPVGATTATGGGQSSSAVGSVGSLENSCAMSVEQLSQVDVRTLRLPDGSDVALSSWDYDVEQVVLPEGVSLLPTVGMTLLEEYGLFGQLGLSKAKALAWLCAVERGYNDMPYHNSRHAADVAQAVHAMMAGCSTASIKFTPLEHLAWIVAAVSHDYGHRGLNNNFLQATMDPLYLQFNGSSVLESMHASESMKLLLGSPDLDFVRGRLGKDDVTELHRLVSQLILATDMARHLEITSLYSARVKSGTFEGNKNDRLLVLQVMLKMADVSNPARAWDACSRWARRVMEEFWRQGDIERERGMAVSPFMDRDTTDMAKCQAAFIQYVVSPLAELVSKVSTTAQVLQANLVKNGAQWARQSASNLHK
eukprot:m51a1_g8828 putative 3 -cyclic-nucleotide phosphodiesterase rega (871) ;mRNA; r:385428-388463